MVPIFDHHVHMDTRSADDYERMAIAGVRRVLVPCTATQERRSHRTAWASRFDRLLELEAERAARFGVELWVALAIAAADVGAWESVPEGLEEVEARLGHPRVVAIGELSLRTFEAEEVELFERQLAMAEARGLPVMIEGPPPQKAFDRLVEILKRALEQGRVSPGRVCLLDLDESRLSEVWKLRLGAYGLPVAPAQDAPFVLRPKLDHRAILRILDRFGSARLMLNTGIHVGCGDPLGLARTVYRLELEGIDSETLRALANDHAQHFFLPND